MKPIDSVCNNLNPERNKFYSLSLLMLKLGDDGQMKGWLVLCFIAISLLVATSAEGNPILITEVFYDTPGTDSLEEWIELYNPMSNDVTLLGYSIADNSGTYYIPNGTSIPAMSVIILARDTDGFQNLYGFPPDVVGLNLNLGNSGDLLTLKKDSDELDMVAWEGKVAGWDIEASTNESIRRMSLGLGPSAWASNQTPDPGSPAPIPEPSTLLLLGGGLVGLAGILYRRKQRLGVD